jgi:hypothetical protein
LVKVMKAKRKPKTKRRSKAKPALSSPAAPSAPVKTREQLMDERVARDFAAVDRINNDKSIEYKIMNERDPNPLGPVPSERNSSSSGAVPSADLTFAQAGATAFANSNFMRSRRVG